jgi:hypothetical protein
LATNTSVSEVFRDPSKILGKQIVYLPFSLAEATTDKTVIPSVNFPDKNPVILLSTANNMQRYTTLFVIVNALHVSGSFSAHHQDLKN